MAGIVGAGLCAVSQQVKEEGSAKEQKAIVIIGRLKDFGTRNWRPSVYVDEVELARSQNGGAFFHLKASQNPRPQNHEKIRGLAAQDSRQRVEPGIRTSLPWPFGGLRRSTFGTLAAWEIPWQITHHGLNSNPNTQRQIA